MWAMSNRDDREEQHSKKYVRLYLSGHRVYELRREKNIYNGSKKYGKPRWMSA